MGWRLWFAQKGRRRSSLAGSKEKEEIEVSTQMLQERDRTDDKLTNGVENSTDKPSSTETSGQTREAQSSDEEGDDVRWEALQGVLMKVKEANIDTHRGRKREKTGGKQRVKGVRGGSMRKCQTKPRRDTHLVSSLHAVELVGLVVSLGLGLVSVELRVRDARSLSCLVDEDDLGQVQVRDSEECQA